VWEWVRNCPIARQEKPFGAEKIDACREYHVVMRDKFGTAFPTQETGVMLRSAVFNTI
jgi:hypothetical protein